MLFQYILYKREKEKKAKKQFERKKLITERVKTHSGPCVSEENVTQMLHVLDSRNAQLEALKDEIRFQKIVFDNESEHLGLGQLLGSLASHLKAFLSSTALRNDFYETLPDKESESSET